MQQLEERNTCVPTDTSLVRSNYDHELNKEETLSVHGLKTSSNNPEENQPQQTEGHKVNVFVIAKEGFPLMPCSAAKAKKLLKAGKAKVVKRCPFTIQLNWTCENQVQEITLGVDSGYANVGFSAVSEKKVLICGEVKLDNRTKKRLDEKRMNRKHRRNKLWYRKPRFLNRSRPKGWLSPSVQRRLDTHVSLIEKIKKILPITKVIVETASFDIQKLDNPEIKGKEYQTGSLYNYTNTKNYIFSRENGSCQLCKKREGKFQLHHITPRSQGGTDKPNNLALLHEACHEKLHKKHLESTLKKNKQYKASTFMNIIHKRFQDFDYQTTFGYITSINRNNLKLEKSHVNDAFVISGGTTQEFSKQYKVIQKRKNNRSLQTNRKGFKPSIRRQHYINQPYDLIRVNNKIYKVVGTHNLGKAVVAINSLGKKIDIGIKKVKELYHSNSLVWELLTTN
jgi:hypothetical protein